MNWIKVLKDKLICSTIWLKWEINDFSKTRGMRYYSTARLLQFMLLKYCFGHINLAYLFAAHRSYPSRFKTGLAFKEIHNDMEIIDRLVEKVAIEELNLVGRRTIVLKSPYVGKDHIEKGVLVITFTQTCDFFYNYVDCSRLLKYFYVVLEPSYAGYCDPSILFWKRYSSYPVVVQATEQKDFSFLQSLKSNLIPVPFGASDWVDFRIFKPIAGIKKEYEAIYVTGYTPIKRHHLLFRAIKQINDPNYRVALVFGRNGDAKAQIEQLINYYSIRHNLAIYESLPQSQLNEILNMSKVNMLLSMKEGSNRSIFEAFFANVPGIVLKNNIGLNKDYINAMTGRLTGEEELSFTLLHFKTNWHEYQPREWALANISPLVTTDKLTKCLKTLAQERGEPWTRDLVPKINSPEVSYFYQEHERSMPNSLSIISLFMKRSMEDFANEQLLRDSLRRICTKVQDSV